jgi:hypothetical protein
MKDPDRSVRRRASLLALGLEGETARRLGEEAIHDEDPEVRALAALALGAGSGENARTLLLGALADRELRVRKAAAQSLSRILGQDVSAVVGLDETHRRREIRRLATLPMKPVRARLEQPRAVVAAAPVQAVAPVQVMAQVSAPVQVAAVVAPVQVMAAASNGAPVQAMAAASNGAPVHAMNGHGASTVQGASAQPVYAFATAGHAQAGSVAVAQPPRPGVAPPSAPAARANPPAPQVPASRLSPVQAALVAMGAVQAQAAAAAQAAPAPAPAPAEPRAAAARPTASPVEALCSQMLAEVRAAVRGRSLVELAVALSAPSELAQEALTLLSARGAVVRRGHKYFAA